MTLDQLVLILNWAIAVGIPLLVALVTRADAKPGTKAITNLLLSGLGTALTSIVASLVAREAVDWFTVIFAFVTSFIVACASYARLWKPLGTTALLEVRGVKSRHSLAS